MYASLVQLYLFALLISCQSLWVTVKHGIHNTARIMQISIDSSQQSPSSSRSITSTYNLVQNTLGHFPYFVLNAHALVDITQMMVKYISSFYYNMFNQHANIQCIDLKDYLGEVEFLKIWNQYWLLSDTVNHIVLHISPAHLPCPFSNFIIYRSLELTLSH